jgi:hypothetical protein
MRPLSGWPAAIVLWAVWAFSPAHAQETTPKTALPSVARVAPNPSRASTAAVHGPAWQVFYDHGFKLPDVRMWTSKSTRSKLMPEGLRIVDPSLQPGSMRYFFVLWNVKPGTEIVVEARLKSISCSAPLGMCLLVADGLHEENISFFPDRISFARSKLSQPFPCATGFHTYTVRVQGADVALAADGKPLIDGAGKFTGPAINGRSQLGFGAGASSATGEAIWQSVRFRGPSVEPPRLTIPPLAGLEVQVGETSVILPGRDYVSMSKLAGGDIVVGDRRSSDGGRSWRRSHPFNVGAYQLPDGQIIEQGFATRKTDRPCVFQVALARSTDNGITARGENALMRIPQATGGTGDNGKPLEGPLCDHAIVGLRDGTLLAAMYGNFKDDTVPCETFPKSWKFYKYRTFVVRSRDRGKTWDYLSTVAYDPSIGLESFCEPDLLVLPGGEILCFMRTGGSGGKYTPLYLSRSADDGLHWTKPAPIADRGVWPNACRMRSGVLACTYGRPGNWLMFSLDQGKTWTAGILFHAGPSSNYNSIEEVAPNRLLVVYDRQTLNPDGELAPEVVGTYFSVRRTAPPHATPAPPAGRHIVK